MRIIDFLYGIIDRFAPMDNETKAGLKLDATASYNKAKDAAFKKKVHNDNVTTDPTIEDGEKSVLLEKLKVVDRVLISAESWWFRTLLAIGFILVVPKIKDYWNGSNNTPGEGGEFDDDEDYIDDDF